MADLSLSDLSMSESDLVSEVRDSLAGLDMTKIPDDTIKQTAKRFTIPTLNDITGKEPDVDRFENALIYWTAEKSFDAWLAYTRIRDAELEVYTRPGQYKERLEERTNVALQQVDATRPSNTPNVSIAVKHDGKRERVDLDGRWKPQ